MIFGTWIIFLIIIVFIFLFTIIIGFYLVHHTRTKLKRIDDFALKKNEDLKSKGVDMQYRDMETTELISEYRRLLDDYDDHKRDLGYIAGVGCRTKFIEDIFIERKVVIPEFNYEKVT
jgi:uncharacterized protein YneF (UPF0154 family)